MSSTKSKAPRPVIASAIAWRRADGTKIPAIRIAGPRSTVFVGPDQFEDLARALVTAAEQSDDAEVKA